MIPSDLDRLKMILGNVEHATLLNVAQLVDELVEEANQEGYNTGYSEGVADAGGE